MTFKETLNIHLESIKNRDIDTLITTLPEEGKETVLILPNGSIEKSRDKFVEGHIEWFADNSWKQECEVINIIESSEMAIATIKYLYTQENEDSFTCLLGLAFKKIKSKWVLVHDQNTIVK